MIRAIESLFNLIKLPLWFNFCCGCKGDGLAIKMCDWLMNFNLDYGQVDKGRASEREGG